MIVVSMGTTTEYTAGKQPPPSHPGAILQGLHLEPAGLTITKVAAHIGVDRKTLSRLVNGSMGVSPLMALRLAKAFNTTPELWLNLQRNYDLWQAEQQFVKENRTIMPFVHGSF